MNINKINPKKSFLKYLPFIIFFIIIFIWHFTLKPVGDEIGFAKVYYNYNIFNYLSIQYETWTSRLLIDFFLVPLSALPRIIWIFFDSIIFLLIALLLPKIMLNIGKIGEKKSFVYNSLSCIIVLIYIFTINHALASAGYIASTLNYTWPLAFVLLHFYLVKKYIFNENNTSTIQKIAIYLIMVFSLIFAINQELMFVVVIGVYFYIILYCLFNKVKIPNSVLFMCFIIFLGFLNIYLSPGNHLRYLSEISTWFPDYYTLNLVNKVDLGITVLLNWIIFSYGPITGFSFGFSYGLISPFFFGIMGIYIYSITKKKIPTLISLIPFIIVTILIIVSLIGYMPIINFIYAGVTRYGLLHSNLDHIIIFSSIYAIIILSIMFSLIQIYKNRGEKLSSIIFGLLILGFISQMMRGFSPTIWASTDRWEIYYYFCITCATYILSVELLESRYDGLESRYESFKKWLVNHKLWNFILDMNRQRLIIILIIAVLVIVSATALTENYLGKDITLTKISSSAVGVPGQNINVTTSLRNRGIIGTGNFIVNFYLTPTMNLENTNIWIGTESFNNIPGRATVKHKTQLTLPINATPGTYYIIAYADPNNNVKELNEYNNKLFSKKIVIR